MTVDGEVVRFRHPLVMAAIYHCRRSRAQRAAHGRGWPRPTATTPTRKVLHRAGALVSPEDDEVAADLDKLGPAERAAQLGERPRRRQARSNNAAQLSETSSNRGRRLVRAAEVSSSWVAPSSR